MAFRTGAWVLIVGATLVCNHTAAGATTYTFSGNCLTAGCSGELIISFEADGRPNPGTVLITTGIPEPILEFSNNLTGNDVLNLKSFSVGTGNIALLYGTEYELINRDGVDYYDTETLSIHITENGDLSGRLDLALYAAENGNRTHLIGFEELGRFSGEGQWSSAWPAPAVPGPIAGAGVPALMALGGFVWARRRKAAAVA